MNGSTSDARVLVVDTDPVSRAVSANVLESAGIPVVGQASDPTQALDLAATTEPTLALIGVAIGGMGPINLARRLREVSNNKIEIVAQAGFSDAAGLGDMVASGTVAYVIKGKPQELVAAIRAVSAGAGIMSAEASRPVLEEIQNLYDREKARNTDLEKMVTQLQALSVTDWLTGLKNHGYFYDRLSEELERSRRYNRPLAVIMADLDDFKSVNDAYGHSSGDAVLRTIGEVFRKELREVDIACRIGGEEFGVIMPETSTDGAIRAAERVRESALATQVPGVGAVTISLGIAVFPQDAELRDGLVEAADEALYIAKHEGKNQTVVAGAGGIDDYSRRPMGRTEPLARSLLKALHLRSQTTAEHSERVADSCTALAHHMGMPDYEIQYLRTPRLCFTTSGD